MDVGIILGWMLLGIFSIKNLTNVVGWVGLGLFIPGTVFLVWTLQRGATPFAAGTIFFANRLAKNNLFFPTQVVINPESVIRYQKRWIGAEEESIGIPQVASVRIDTGLLWSDVVIESSGGTDPIRCHGHRNVDALAMQSLIRQYQTQREPPAPARQTAPAAVPDHEEWITAALVAPPLEPGRPPLTLASTTCHLPPRPEEAALESTLGHYLNHGPEGSWITITKVPVPFGYPGNPTGFRPPPAARD
jgi:hypothetical protein